VSTDEALTAGVFLAVACVVVWLWFLWVTR
jgi:hypothetical protein